jgi:uncharacterized membrane protein YgcG
MRTRQEKFILFLESITTESNKSIMNAVKNAVNLLEANEQLSGGMADGKEPSEFDREQLAMGLIVEMEHTDDPKIALEIAMDHLVEHSDYYERLAKMEEGISDEDRDELTEAKKKKRKSKKKKRKSRSRGMGYPFIGGYAGFSDFDGGGFDGGGGDGGGGGE